MLPREKVEVPIQQEEFKVQILFYSDVYYSTGISHYISGYMYVSVHWAFFDDMHVHPPN